MTVGALLAGVVTAALGLASAVYLAGLLTFASGLVAAFAMTLKRVHPPVPH